MIDIVVELRCVDRNGSFHSQGMPREDGHPVCQRAADEIERLRCLLVEGDQVYKPVPGQRGASNWRAGLDDLSRELLSILANIQTAATMSAVLVIDPEEQAAWEAVRDKAAEGAQAYRKAKYPPATDQQAD